MYLKALELHGFKSFPDKTRIVFQKGMSAVVGPNGSGKSNISDAIRWVLGESSSRQLRGAGKMEDIIFGGTQKRSAMGFASVSLILDNTEKSFDLDSDEVSITRKYYRSGDSEYLINSNKVRLKDIYELFFDTGLGKNGYSIVGQGKIQEIVTAKPEARREIFEEASGISKFRYKKNEAEKNLDKAQENILRLNDILSSLQTRVEPLRKESEKAKEFLKLSQDKKQKEVSLWVYTTEKSKGLLRDKQRNLEMFQADYEEIEKQLSDKEALIEQRYLYANSLLLKSDENMQSIRDIEQEISDNSAQVKVLESRIEYNNNNIKVLDDEIAALNSEDENYQSKSDEIKNNIQNLEADILKKQTEIDALLEKITALTDRAKQSDEKKGEYLEKINTYNQDIQNMQIEYHTLNTQKENFKENLEKAKEEITKAKEYFEISKAQVDEIVQFITVNDEEIQKNQNIKDGLNLKLSNLTDKKEALQIQLNKNEAKQNENLQKIKLLTDMEQSLDGFSYSVKTILTASKNGKLDGVLGTVSQLINVNKGYETAIETALGYSLQNIVVKNEVSAKRAIEFLKTTKGGRATFLPLDTIKPQTFNEKLPEYAKTADKVITTKDEYKNIVSSLLARTVLVEDINTASQLAKNLNYRYRTVTLDGQQVNIGGSFTGGSTNKSVGLFSRKVEIENIKKEIESLQIAKKDFDSQLLKLQDEIDLYTSQNSAYEGQIQILSEDKTNAQIRLATHTQEKNQYEAVMNNQQNIINNIDIAFKNNENRYNEIEKEIKEKTDKLATISKDYQDITKQDETVILQQNEYNEALQNLKLSNVQLIADKDILLSLLNQANERKQDKDRQQELILTQKNNLIQQNEENKAEILNFETIMSELKAEISKKEQENKDMAQERLDIERQRNEITQNNKQLFTQKEDLLRQIVKADESIKSIEASYDEIVMKLWEEYELTISSASEMAQEVENEAQLKKDVAALKSAIKKLGDVNVGAIEEYKEVFEQYTFLNEQLSDLEESKAQLIKLITSLNAEMRSLFLESLEIINDNFKKIFSELFAGGSATIKLTDEENVLESGIEIEVSPPGKVIKNLTSLSGGEQALVAISVYFAILEHNPAPFCILDEIEAALDEVNVTRYANYLHRISNKTQFIVITHRRGTMDAADILYGVTMQEDGISKLLKLDANNLNTDILN